MFFAVLFIILSNLIQQQYYAVLGMAYPLNGMFTKCS